MQKVKYIDLFAGCGGLSLGLHNAGLEGCFAIEKDKMAYETLRYNLIFRKRHFKLPKWLDKSHYDINNFIKKYSYELSALKGKVDLVVGGPPCQGFSMAGKRDSDDIRNSLVNSYIDFINIVEPKAIFLENVQGINMEFGEQDGTYADLILYELKQLRYRAAWRIIDMSEFGVPQKRRRFILVAFKDQDPNIFFKKLYKNINIFLKKKKIASFSISDAISDLHREHGEVECPDYKSYNSGIYGGINSGYQRLMRKEMQDGAIPDSHRFTKHTDKIIKMQKQMLINCPRDRKVKPSDNYVKGLKRRSVTVLSEGGHAPTITSIPDEMVHYKEPRILTVREMARIQSFPDHFEFKGKYTTGGEMRKKEVPRYTQIGNAIPPLFAEQVGLVFKDMLGDDKNGKT